MNAESSVEHVVSASDWDDFVVVCYFGRDGDWLDRCMRRAYLDMNRTLHGMDKLGKGHADWKSSALRVLRDRLTMLPGEDTWTQASFDAWHHESVDMLKRSSSEHGFSSLSVGQGQKWINMSIKYAIALGERRVPGFFRVYDVAHVALDNIVLERLTELGMSPLGCAWSRLDDYGQYMGCQQWIRDHFQGNCLLEVEYRLWQDAPPNAGESRKQ
ncbi:MAG TPA: hypothetical protein VFB98_08215 [Candidatus Deferrimicrobium sp.]|nr:hypothetical protein [Candidatus Deferrimicrobium sp.]